MELKRNSVKELVLGQDGKRGPVLCWDGAVHDKPSVCEGVRVQEMLVGIWGQGVNGRRELD